MRKQILFLILFAAMQSITHCDSEGSGPYKFFSKTAGVLLNEKEMKLSLKCFNSVSIYLSMDENGFNISIKAEHKSSYFCLDYLIFSTGKNFRSKFMFFSGEYKLLFTKSEITSDEQTYILNRGISVLKNCVEPYRIPISIFRTIKVHFGGLGLNPWIPIFGSKIPEYQLKANLEFVKDYIGLELKRRPNPRFIHLDKKYIKSGDFLAISRFDGFDQIIHYISGSRIGHCVMALWKHDDLYIIESQDAGNWPKKGIQKTLWEDWLIFADNADFNVSIIPLKESLRKKFDVEKAWRFFDSLEGKNYGFHNFVFVAYDTEELNIPPLADLNFLSIIFSYLEKLMPKTTEEIILEGLNKRLNTTGLKISQIWDEIYKRNTTLGELLAVAEQDGWNYSDGPNYVCSSIMIGVYKAGGLFEDLNIQATEFTPKDLLDLDFWDISGKVPEECKEFSPHGYCQIMGKVDMDLGKVSFVTPYENMDEKCPSLPPDYERTNGC